MKQIIASMALAALAMPAFAQTAWDTDGDATLNPSEFVAGFAAEDTFARFDMDGSTQLDESEWGSGLTAVGEYQNMDLNGDGGVGEAEYNALLFNRYDIDGSGAIEAGEMTTIEMDLAEDGLLAR